MLMRSFLRSFLAAALLLAAMGSATAQRGIKVENLPNFDLHRFHFGFHLSYNTSDFQMVLDKRSPFRDSLLVLSHAKQPGFDLTMLASLNVNPFLSFRFSPTLSFQERVLTYSFRQEDNSTKYFQKSVESTYLQFPLLLKYRSARINNFAVYLLGGGKFCIDMASQKDVNNSLDDEVVVKLDKYDYAAEVGGGMDMFLTYFKFGVELKAAFGIPNLLVDDGTRFSTPIQSLRSKVWVLTFTFEG